MERDREERDERERREKRWGRSAGLPREEKVYRPREDSFISYSDTKFKEMFV